MIPDKIPVNQIDSTPVDGSYASEALMIADQGNQVSNFIYFDGEKYWEYLGTTIGTIADYRAILSGERGAGIGLSIDGNNDIRLGDASNFVQVNSLDFLSPGFIEAIPTQTETFSLFMSEDTGTGARLFIGKDYDTGNTQLLKFNANGTVTFNDDVLLTGIKYEQDYEANFTARSLITKQYVDLKVQSYTSTAIDYTVLSTDRIVAATAGLITITLPTSQVTNLGKEFKIDNASTANIFVVGEGGESIQGETVQTVFPDSCMNVYANGTAWRIS